MKKTESIILAADLAGTAVFAVEGAVAAMRGGLDLLGVMVLSFVVALGGGVIRDLLIGATPPNAIRDWRYPALAFVTGLLTFVGHAQVLRVDASPLVALDAAGLALFAVAGAQKALDYGIGPFIAALMGTVTGVGGGVMRDLLLARIPTVLVTDIYASAAFVGGAMLVVGRRAGLPPAAAALSSGAACFAVRMAAFRYGWHLPRAAP
ncbi:trimeric intracellular cation channel family protein [Burkholderia alba]|uniref:trimeric intracellular cation channel family protein n=1 Tax=Burkholderia alba TaxID=2683677 RepID=UPI002B05D27D|nr:trimeric intracellular cation channel family protein [Burkholderia alba]